MAHWTRLRCRSPASTFSGRERARASAELIRSRRWKRRKRGDLSLFLFSITNEGIVFFFLPNCHDCPGIEEEKKTITWTLICTILLIKSYTHVAPLKKKKKSFFSLWLVVRQAASLCPFQWNRAFFPSVALCAARLLQSRFDWERETAGDSIERQLNQHEGITCAAI